MSTREESRSPLKSYTVYPPVQAITTCPDDTSAALPSVEFTVVYEDGHSMCGSWERAVRWRSWGAAGAVRVGRRRCQLGYPARTGMPLHWMCCLQVCSDSWCVGLPAEICSGHGKEIHEDGTVTARKASPAADSKSPATKPKKKSPAADSKSPATKPKKKSPATKSPAAESKRKSPA
eukprot:COSAG03_NODE_2559_length_2647_cov_79.376374_3_plen_177_part_00